MSFEVFVEHIKISLQKVVKTLKSSLLCLTSMNSTFYQIIAATTVMYKSLILVLYILLHLVFISYNRDHYSLGRLTQHKIKENLVAFFQNLSASEKNKPSADIFNQIP